MSREMFSDEEIINALERCRQPLTKCGGCPYEYERPFPCFDDAKTDAIDLINRQKAEVKRLRKENIELSLKNELLYNEGKAWYEQCKTAKAEAISEFAERLKEGLFYRCGDINYTEGCDTRRLIDQIAKELTEEKK